MEAAAREVQVVDADAEFADEGLAVEIDQLEIDQLVAQIAAAAGSEGEPAPRGEPGQETADSVPASELDESPGPVAAPGETPSDLPVGQQIAALLDAGDGEDAESPTAFVEEPTH